MIKKLSIVIPAFNEQQIIEQVLTDLKDLLASHDIDGEIIVVDDGSTDDTAKHALAAGVRVLRHRSNRGYGASLKSGILAASNDICAITDADGTYPIKYLPKMLEDLETADMVVGARTGADVHIPTVRKPAKWALNKLANFVSGYTIPDINSGLRVFRRDVAVQYFPILPDQFSWTTTITMAMLCDKYAVKYLPIDYKQRVGKSKITPWDAGTFTVLILRMAVLFRPLRVFLPVTGLCFAYAILKGFVDLTITGDRNISATAIMMFMCGLIVMLIGMVADAVSRMGKLNPAAVASARAKDTVEVHQDDSQTQTKPKTKAKSKKDGKS